MQAKYGVLGLQDNPFPRTPIPSDECLELTIDFRGVLNRLIDQYLIVLKSGISLHAALVGPYGSGKTHMLKALAKKLPQKQKTLVSYLPSPGYDFLSIYSRFMREIPKEILLQLDPPTKSHIHKILDLLRKNPDDPTVLEWIQGVKLPYKIRNKKGIGSNINSEDAVELLAEFIETLFYEGRRVVLLIDEVESILDLPIYRRQSYLSLLRRLIDFAPKGLYIILSCTPAGWDDIATGYPALARRMSRVFYLDNLNLDEALHLTKSYIQRYRLHPRSDLYPLDVEVLRYITEISNGNVGEILKLLSILIDEAIINRLEVITRENAVKLLAGYV